MDRGDHCCDPSYYGLGMYEVDMRTEQGQGGAAAAAAVAAATAAAAAEAAAEGGHFGDGDVGNDRKREGSRDQEGALGHDGDGGSQESGPQEQQQPREDQESAPVAPQPLRRRPRIQYKFSAWQVQELESVFHETQYPDVLTRRGLARRVYLAESKVQDWFKYRRAKHRKTLRESLLRNAPLPAQDTDDATREGP